MKIRFLRNVVVEMKNPYMDEIWDKYFTKWQELDIEQIEVQGQWACLITYKGDIYIDVPLNSFQIIS